MKVRSQVKHGSRNEPERNAQDVVVAPGIVARSPVRLFVEDCNGYDAEMDVEALPATAGRAGRFVCRELRVKQRAGGPPVTSEALRGIPVATLTKQAGAWNVLSVDSTSGGVVRMSKRALTQETVGQLKAGGPTDDALWWVAYLYRLALVLGEPPTKSVEEVLELPRSTAGRWVAVARQRGLLGTAEGVGKAGG